MIIPAGLLFVGRELYRIRTAGALAKLFLILLIPILTLGAILFTSGLVADLLSGTRLVSARITACNRSDVGTRQASYHPATVDVGGVRISQLYFINLPGCTPGEHLLLLTNRGGRLIEIDPPGADPADATPLQP